LQYNSFVNQNRINQKVKLIFFLCFVSLVGIANAKDSDKDGVSDKEDECPSVPEDKDRFQDMDGCPEPDNDRDRICDPWIQSRPDAKDFACHGSDKCPDEAEDQDGIQDEDGCPDLDLPQREDSHHGSGNPDSTSQASSKSPERIAVLEFKCAVGAGLTDSEKRALTDLIRTAALELPFQGFSVMTRENITDMLPPGTLLADCEGECEVETGRKAGASYVVSGEILRFGTAFKLLVRIHDTRNSRLLTSQESNGKTIDLLYQNTQQAALELFQKLQVRIKR
jgi:TolB-like protein